MRAGLQTSRQRTPKPKGPLLPYSETNEVQRERILCDCARRARLRAAAPAALFKSTTHPISFCGSRGPGNPQNSSHAHNRQLRLLHPKHSRTPTPHPCPKYRKEVGMQASLRPRAAGAKNATPQPGSQISTSLLKTIWFTIGYSE